ncbi:MAG: carboxymuconolactone decarboxylase family protein [Lysobacterales bacterium]
MPFHYPQFGSNTLSGIFSKYPERGVLMLRLIADVMDETDELSKLDKETVFAFSSFQNACTYCFESHKAVAHACGLDESVFDQIVADLNSANIDQRMRVMLSFVQKLSRTPSRIVESDVQALIAEGFSEEAVMDIVSVCALANYMNCFVDGLGVAATREQAKQGSLELVADDAYRQLLAHFESLIPGRPK